MSLLDYIPAGRRPDPDLASASPAMLGRRGIATAIDLVICYLLETTILAGLLVYDEAAFVELGGQAIVLSVIGLVPVYLLYCLAFEYYHGWTPGKKRMEVLVVMDDGSNVTLLAAVIRNALRYVDWLPVGYLLGWLVARRSPDGRRLGDRLANTVVARPAPGSDSSRFDRDADDHAG